MKQKRNGHREYREYIKLRIRGWGKASGLKRRQNEKQNL